MCLGSLKANNKMWTKWDSYLEALGRTASEAIQVVDTIQFLMIVELKYTFYGLMSSGNCIWFLEAVLQSLHVAPSVF